MDHKTAEKDACQMEHAVCSETIERLVDFLIKGGYSNGFNNLKRKEGSGQDQELCDS